ncbi:MAG: DUF3095 domain-containing protein [Magnetococcales bacterium]|nr:DUF3095 domain-containing protein [Magnetococcales bacterium]MBF0150975.1 DUF3095 domain-containing protein [Magnetococcales bacterium]MBF0174038.1 DUF3095 domain-containing protein [Magnetococcales bacterium]
MESITTFYDDMIPLKDFRQITGDLGFSEVPDDWWIAVTDVQSSTEAIQAGRYKEVNMSGALVIVAALNIVGDREIPFVFGGDGASLLIPAHLADAIRKALAETARRVADGYGLILRAGMIPMAHLRAIGAKLRVAKVIIGDGYHQAVFRGDGMTRAETIIKDPEAGRPFRIDPGANRESIDFKGLECRWQDVPSPHGEIVSLLVAATNGDPAQDMSTYDLTLKRINDIYGDDAQRHPIAPPHLNLSFSSHQLRHEALLFAPASSFSRWLYVQKLRLINLLGRMFMDANPFHSSRWRHYRQRILASCDYQKFDGTLRMVMAGTPEQRVALDAWLKEEQRQGRLIYGLHVTDRALMTCLIFQRHGRHVHFVDGADGGYALAARALKAGLKTITSLQGV